jgi:ring-1,2-phenylacetyl-CoA epoxidase subunit PaaE
MSPRFHTLEIAEVRRETPDAVSLLFKVPAEFEEAYRFAPGQYLTLKAAIDGEEVRRSYSICTAPEDCELRVAVKRVDGGAFSTFANEALKAGDRLDVMTPMGRFTVEADPAAERLHVAVACGSGITPVLSLAKSLLAREPGSRFVLLYGNRTAKDILFREEIAALKDRYLDRFSVFHVLSREMQDLPVLHGRLDGAKLGLLLRSLVPAARADDIFLCGPEGMIASAEAVLAELDVAPDRIHVERFVPGEGGRRAVPRQVSAGAAPKAIAEIVLDGHHHNVPVAAGETVIDAALRAGLDLPYACKGGMCCTCRAKLTDGKVDMAVNYSLQAWEIEAGFVLTCQSSPVTDKVTLDYDAV